MRAIILIALLAVATPGCFKDIVGGIDGVEPADYIRDDDYSKWTIEFDHVSGVTPPADAINHMKSQIGAMVRKDITINVDDGNIPAKTVWTSESILALDKFKDGRTSGDTIVTQVVYLNGEYEQENVLGVAFGHKMVAIFGEKISDGCGGAVQCLAFSPRDGHRAVLTHEIGHIIGLVNNGVPMVNAHQANGAHSSNSNSVMNASTRTADVFFLSSIPTTFDSNDKLDICAFGGKGSC